MILYNIEFWYYTTIDKVLKKGKQLYNREPESCCFFHKNT